MNTRPHRAGRLIRCQMCNLDFRSTTTDAEAAAEYAENFTPAQPGDTIVSVCDSCFEILVSIRPPKRHPHRN